MRCPVCGYENEPGCRFCEQCGTELDTAGVTGDENHCPNCGSPVQEGARFCPSCGYALGEEKRRHGTGFLVLIGVLIGLAVLAMVFVVVFLMNGKDDDQTDPTTTTTTEEQSEYDDEEDDWTDDDRYSYDEPEVSVYASYSDDELYDYSTPIFFPESVDQYITEADIYGMSDDQLQKAINDIYARNGLIFSHDDIQSYYYYVYDYYPVSDVDEEIRARMNRIERENVEFLKEHM